MNTNLFSQKLYQPIQPTAGSTTDAPVRYIEFPTSLHLQPYIHCYWLLWSEAGSGSEISYRIISDGCIDLFINCEKFENIIVAGTSNASATVQLKTPVKYFGIRFTPGSFFHFFPASLKELANKMIPCNEIWGNSLSKLESLLFSATSNRERVAIAESFLINKLSANRPKHDVRLLSALDEIYTSRGLISIEKNSSLSSLSPRQLRRLFDQYIGVSPKVFARIVRFQSILKSMTNVPTHQWKKLCFDFGYCDQSHYIREFNIFFGDTPTTAEIFY